MGSNPHVLVPSAGIIEREIEQEYAAQPLNFFDKRSFVQIEIPERHLDFPEGKKVWIQSVNVVSNSAVCEEEIRSWIAGCLNQDLSIKNIYELCQLIDTQYAKMGFFLARAYPPPQTIEDGNLTIEIIEGSLGNIRVCGNIYYSEKFIRSYFSHLQYLPLRYEDFLTALLFVNDNMDLFVSAVFEKGQEFGTCDLVLNVDDEYPAHLYLNGNNYGQDLTTNTRVGSRLDWGNFFMEGDLFSITEVVGLPISDLCFTNVDYLVPLNRRGTSLELSYLSSRFNIEELEELHLWGSSNIATLGVNQAIVRERYLNVDLFSFFDYKQIKNYARCKRESFDKLRVLTFGLNLDDFIPCCARNNVNVQFAFGIPNFLDGLKAVDADSSREGAGGRFFKFNIDYDRVQPLMDRCFFYFHGSAQWTPDKLTLPELFYIGGDNTVRGYPLAVALGDNGYYFNTELHFPIPGLSEKKCFNSERLWGEVVEFDLFLDHGGVLLKSCKKTFLTGIGAGVNIYGPYGINVSVDVGFPLAHKKLSKEVYVYIKVLAQPF